MIYSTQLKAITNLFEERKRLLNEKIANLTFEDVNDEKTFENTKDEILRSILLKPVEFEAPQIMRHRQEVRHFSSSYQYPMGGDRPIEIITIAFPFVGTPELIEVVPMDVMYPGGNVYLPVGKTVTVTVEIDTLDKERAFSEAHAMLNTTKQIVKLNNKQADEWSQRNQPIIESQLDQRRKQLIDFFG